MTLGLPGDLSRDSVGRAIVHAGHVGAWVYLAMGGLTSIAVALTGMRSSWIAASLAAAMAVLLVLVALHRTVVTTLVYLVLGGAATVAMTVLAMAPGYDLGTTNNSIVAIPCVALVLVGGAGAGSVAAIAWVVAGFAVGQVASWIGAWIAEAPFEVNVAAVGTALLVILIRSFDGLNRRSGLRRQTALVRANVRAREAVARRDYELEAITSLHDIAMGHLLAIASAGSGPIDERRRADIRQDLGLVVGRDWIDEHGTGATTDPVPVLGGHDGLPTLDHAFNAAADEGLDVQMTGDLAVLGVLGPVRAADMDEAVAECLRNVARHAGVTEAELLLGHGGGEVTVAVMDSGTGFDPDLVPVDRRGIRIGVRQRLGRHGGSAQVWSAIGIGTTVVLTVPEGGE
ncbi:sensor histidine kinase [Agromyces sp. Marseille-Q5079]|uniref:sensor histidine kinase n=1 Tax=Agromyces sp. Marseille-Q5079 TaxID=3439059 RepID=UPI003D9CAE51